MNYLLILLAFVILSVVYTFIFNPKLIENWGSTPAAFIQLASNNPAQLYIKADEIVHPGYYHHHEILPYY